jgi:hypothetical protein
LFYHHVSPLDSRLHALNFQGLHLTNVHRYLLRAEIIALHAASNYPGAQFYMECAQINVQSASTTKREDGHDSAIAPRRHLATRAGAFSPSYVGFPGAYKGTDPGVKFQLYWPKPTSYVIPGPRPLVC